VQLLEHTCAIRRNAPVGTNGRRQLADKYTGVRCLVLPMNDATTIRHEFTLGRAFDIYFADGQDVKVGDQVVFDAAKYTVRSVQPYKVPHAAHIRAMCEQEVS
jgi:hypothetical protein